MSFKKSVRWTRLRLYVVVTSLLLTIVYLYIRPTGGVPPPPPLLLSGAKPGHRIKDATKSPDVMSSAPGYDDVEMVVASLRSENITWLDDYLLDWKKNIYVVDDDDAELKVPQNKGREAMVFLTYVILEFTG